MLRVVRSQATGSTLVYHGQSADTSSIARTLDVTEAVRSHLRRQAARARGRRGGSVPAQVTGDRNQAPMYHQAMAGIEARVCAGCAGTGSYPGLPGNCRGCAGTGGVAVALDDKQKPMKCAICTGTGRPQPVSSMATMSQHPKFCPACKGSGWAAVIPSDLKL